MPGASPMSLKEQLITPGLSHNTVEYSVLIGQKGLIIFSNSCS